MGRWCDRVDEGLNLVDVWKIRVIIVGIRGLCRIIWDINEFFLDCVY